jgi:exodeoxyribonuclease V
MRRDQVEPQQILRGGQVICGKNATRLQLNLAMKQAAGFLDIYPTGNGEKIICLKNRNDIGVINGMFLTLTDIADEDELFFTAGIATEDGKTLGSASQKDEKPERFKIYKGHFDDHVRFDPEREQRDYRKKRGCIEAVWGWAITCHKSQGSQWGNVVVYDDGLGRTPEDRARWLYTAITRAERGLVLLD